jgi:L-alanine-DL-glutamate epimerase-like enolase superfamily enzyme
MIIERIKTAAYKIPTTSKESDGTIEWDSTTLVVVELESAGVIGFGYTYAHSACCQIIEDLFYPLILGGDPFAIEQHWAAMNASVRNIGRPGIASCAISAVDVALWDLKARLLNLSLVDLLGKAKTSIPVYGSGGFTSYSIFELQDQLTGWVDEGFKRVKMKVGRVPSLDPLRVQKARSAIGLGTELYVDANGAYDVKEALGLADKFADYDVTWFEEPVSSDDLKGLRLIRESAPNKIEIAAGEYGYTPYYFRQMIESSAVDVLQADATRCGGITGFVKVNALCEAEEFSLSSHCAPTLHMAIDCAMPSVRHLEYFYDHARIEEMLFDGFIKPLAGNLHPDLTRPGLGVEFKWADAESYILTESEAIAATATPSMDFLRDSRGENISRESLI